MTRYPLALLIAGVVALQAQAAEMHDHHAMKDPAANRFAAAMSASMEKMHSDMMSVHLSGDPDRDFLAQMVPHHQGAIDMAKAVLLETKDPRIRNLAMSIITEQQYEIELMKTMLANEAAPATQTETNP